MEGRSSTGFLPSLYVKGTFYQVGFDVVSAISRKLIEFQLLTERFYASKGKNIQNDD